MSKSILKIALLLIFTYLFRIHSVLAQDSDHECKEKGPYYGDWILVFCPLQNTAPSINPTSFYGNVDTAPCEPNTIPPTYWDGIKEQPITYDCPCPEGQKCPTSNRANISYKVSKVMWDPPLPSKFSPSDAPQFTSTAYVNVTSSDQLCPSPGRVDIGTGVWNVLGVPVTKAISIDGSYLKKFTGLMKIATAGACESTFDPSKIDVKFSETDTEIACDCINGPVKTKIKLEGSGTQSLGSIQCDFPFLGVAYVASVNVTVGGSLDMEYSINGEGNPCNGRFKICGNINFSGNINGGISAIIASRKVIYASGTINTSISGSGEICYDSDSRRINIEAQGCRGKVDIIGKVVLFGGFSVSYTANLADSACT